MDGAARRSSGGYGGEEEGGRWREGGKAFTQRQRMAGSAVVCVHNYALSSRAGNPSFLLLLLLLLLLESGALISYARNAAGERLGERICNSPEVETRRNSWLSDAIGFYQLPGTAVRRYGELCCMRCVIDLDVDVGQRHSTRLSSARGLVPSAHWGA